MSTIVTRAGKGSPLTNTEVDSNFTNLNTDKVEKSGSTMTGDLAFGDNVKAKFGAGNDLQIYHDGSNSYITDQGTGYLNISTNGNTVNISKSPFEYMASFAVDGAVSLYYDNSKKFDTTSSGVDITGTVVADGLTVDGTNQIQFNNGKTAYVTGNPSPFIYRTGTSSGSEPFDAFGNLVIQARSNAAADVYVVTGITPANRLKIEDTGDISFYEDTGTTAKLTWDASAEELQFKDSVKAEFGDGGDFTLTHNGVNTQVVNNTGALQIIQTADDNDVVIYTDNGSGSYTDYFRADGSTGEVKIFHYGSQKLATKSTGIDVTGTVTADQLQIEGSTGPLINLYRSDVNALFGAIQFKDTTNTNENARIGWAANELRLQGTDKVSLITDDKTRLFVANSGDISFYDDAGTSQDFYWDASTSRLGLGTTSPSSKLQIQAGDLNVGGNDSSNPFSKIRLGASQYGACDIVPTDESNHKIGMAFYVDGTQDTTINPTEAMRIDSSGRLGIGTTSPAYTLDVSGSTPTIRIRSSSDNDTSLLDMRTVAAYSNESKSIIKLGSPSNGSVNDNEAIAWHIEASGDESGFPQRGYALKFIQDERIDASTSQEVEAMRLTSDGRLGIGTTSPAASLHVVKNDAGFEVDLDNVVTDGVRVLAYDRNTSTDRNIQYRAAQHFFNIGSSEKARIDSSGNLLVGRSSFGFGGTGHIIRSTLSAVFNNDGGAAVIANRNTSDGTIVDFRKDGTTVGSIGTNGSDLYLGTGNTGISFFNSGSNIIPYNSDTASYRDAGVSLGYPTYRFDNLYLSGGISNPNASGTLTFSTAGSEAARFDSSGNLLVGTTDNLAHINSSAGEGIALSAGSYGGFIGASRSNYPVMALNRQTSDGEIIQFRKDGTTVGSIGTVFSDLCIGTGDTGIRFWDAGPGIFPVDPSNTFANKDNAVDLGLSSVRWKDLYLSGGVYLGGVGSSNLLDDYEEGTWTPVLVGSTSGSISSFTTQQASYVKVGDLVQISLYLNSVNVSTSTISGNILIGGLPFSGDSFSGVANITYCNLFNFVESDVSITGYFNGTSIHLIKGSSTTSITDSDESSGVTGGALMMTLVYQI